MNKYKIILNPLAGNGNGERVARRIEHLLRHHNLEFDLTRTEHPWHAVQLAKGAVFDKFNIIVAAGGDGTVNEVINGLMQAKQTGYHGFAMGVLCVGRGNDFAHSVGIPNDLDKACHILVQNQRRLVDIGRFTGGRHPEGRYFGNCVGIGFDTIATIEANKLPRMGGFLNYLIAVVKTIFLYYKGPLVHLKYNDQTLTQPSLLISIMNGRRLGGGFLMAPQAEPDDGFLDLCIADQVSRLRIFTLIPHFIRGTQATQPEINTARTAHITITAVEGTLPAQIDGEIISTDDKQLDIELLPRQIEIVYSPPEKVQ